MRIPLMFAVALVSGCSRDAPVQEESRSAKPAASAPAEPPVWQGRGEKEEGDDDRSGAASAAPEGARTVVDVAGCTATCVERNSMRAEAPEKIEGDCRARCKTSCEAQCESGSEASKAACRAECEVESD